MVGENTQALYLALRKADPTAVAYYEGLKKRIADGKRAQLVMNAIMAAHEQHQASIGAVAGHVTPNGRVLTQEAMSQLISACYAAASR